LLYQIHRPKVIIKSLIRKIFTILENSSIETFQKYESGLIAVAEQETENKLFRRQVLHSYDVKLRDRGIPEIDRDFYLQVREELAWNIIDEFEANDDIHLAAVLLFLDRNNIIVTRNRLLKSSTLRAFFSQTSASLIFTPNILLLTFNTINPSSMQENTGGDNYNSLSHTSHSHSISEAIDSQNESVKIITEADPEIRVPFYNVEIPENLNPKNIKKTGSEYSSRGCLILSDE